MKVNLHYYKCKKLSKRILYVHIIEVAMGILNPSDLNKIGSKLLKMILILGLAPPLFLCFVTGLHNHLHLKPKGVAYG